MTRRDTQRSQLQADGTQALAMIARGSDIKDVLAIVGGSRARLYRAMAMASEPQTALPGSVTVVRQYKTKRRHDDAPDIDPLFR
jgi:hypothetical protein